MLASMSSVDALPHQGSSTHSRASLSGMIPYSKTVKLVSYEKTIDINRKAITYEQGIFTISVFKYIYLSIVWQII